MTKPNHAKNTPKLLSRGPQPPRMRPPLKEAVSLIIEKGITQREAARRVGMNETSLGRALAKPHIKAWIDNEKALFLTDMLKLKDRAKAIAIATGIELMHSATSEAVRARMVELFAGEPKKANEINVQINNDRGGYEFVRPGSQLVEIKATPDSLSGGEAIQAVDIADDYDESET